MSSCFYSGLSLETVYPSHARKPLSWSVITSVEYVRCQPTTFCWNYREPIIQRICSPLASLNYMRLHHLQSVSSVGQSFNICESYSTEFNPSPFGKLAMDEDAEVDCFSASNKSLSNRSSKEEQRRRKIGLANKGKVPWNKGRKHTEETRMRIKQRTIEALRNPEVRKKMSEHPQLHSEEIKEKIRSSVRRVWDKRLKWKRSKEKFISSWSENIAEAARKGGHGQQELDWDSYDRIKEKIVSEQLQFAAEKTKAKKLAKLRAERAAKARAEKMERLAERKKVRKERARGEMKIGKSENNNKQNTAVASELKLKQRLTKIHKKKPKHGRVAIARDRVFSVMPNWDKPDMEMIKNERVRRDISLADQIQAAKNRRANDAFSGAVLSHETSEVRGRDTRELR